MKLTISFVNGDPARQLAGENRVNCWKATAKAKPISSQAAQEWAEGSEARAGSPDRTVKPHERAASLVDDDMVRHFVKAEGRRLNALA